MNKDDCEAAIKRAAADVSQLESLGLSPEKMCLMLSPRHSREVMQHLFPNVGIPEPAPESARPMQKRALTFSPLIREIEASALSNTLEIQQRTRSPAAASQLEPIRLSQPTTIDKLAFQYVPLIQCTFPHSEQTDLSTYTRRNGRLELTIATSLAGVGLPYGVPARLLTIYAATEVVRTKSREIFLGRTITEFLRRLDVTVTSGRRGTINAYLDQLRRLIHAVFTVEENIEDGGGRQGLHIRKVLFAEEARLWSDGDNRGGEGSSILLSEPLFESMLERSAPLSLDAIRQLRKSPMDLDLYAWLVYRLFHLRRALTIPWSELALQFGQSYSRERDFRTFFQTSLKRVLKEYPEARVQSEVDGLKLLPSRHHIARSRSEA